MNKTVRSSFLVVCCLLLGFHGHAQQDSLSSSPESHECGSRQIVVAGNQYDLGQFNECISQLKECISNNGFPEYSEKVQAYRYIALCYLALDSVQEADKAIVRLITLNDNYETDLRDPERFRIRLTSIRQRLRATLISSVSKKSENIEKAPATIQIISEAEIRHRGYKDVEEIFSDLPGFDISRTRGVVYSVMYERGYRSAASTDRTLVLVDGVEDNDMWSNSVYLSKQFPVSNIKRIEIIYGPASTIYGANAFAGVVNIVTKTEDDYFEQGKTNKVTAVAQAGVGPYNTKYGEATVATRSKKVFFSVTGRAYHSDEQDLSEYEGWDGKYDFDESVYTKALSIANNAKNDSILKSLDPTGLYHQVSGNNLAPTAYALAKADSLDKSNYRKTFRGVDPGKFTNPKNDYYISSRLNIGDLKLGLEYFNRDEGASPDYSQKFYTINSALQNWQVRQGYFSANYDKKVTERFRLTSFSYYRISDRGKNAVLTPFTSYANGGLSLYSLEKNVQPYFTPTYYSTQSTQFRTELRGLYNLTEQLDISGGLELRNGLLQGDYVKSSLEDPLANGVGPDSANGGNYYGVVDIGARAQISYKNTTRKINLDLGGRVDNNRINNVFGYGTVFNPRIAAVWYPSDFIFKAIYSEAFLDASPFNKFSTTSSRLLNNPTLAPEKVKNYEFSARLTNHKKSYVELAYYHSMYSNSVSTATVIYKGKTTTQFQALGKADIQGLQLAAETQYSRFNFYFNATYTDPYSLMSTTKGEDSAVRMGDIAVVSANAGVNAKFFKDHINANLRVNVVGDKATGKNTTTAGNPNTSIPGYTLLNGTLGYKFKKIGVLQVRVDNILDVEYFSPGIRSASGIQSSMVPLPGRIYYAQFNFNLTR